MVGYNGWRNRETWLINLCLTGDYDGATTAKYWEEAAEEAMAEAIREGEDQSRDPGSVRLERYLGPATEILAARIESEITDRLPEPHADGFVADIFGDPLADADWSALAEALVDDVLERVCRAAARSYPTVADFVG